MTADIIKFCQRHTLRGNELICFSNMGNWKLNCKEDWRLSVRKTEKIILWIIRKFVNEALDVVTHTETTGHWFKKPIGTKSPQLIY